MADTKEEAKSVDDDTKVSTEKEESSTDQKIGYKWWIAMGMYSLFLLGGQTVAQILGKLYFLEGGKCNWLLAFAQNAGFPLLLPLYHIFGRQNHPTTTTCVVDDDNDKHTLVVGAAYTGVGVLIALHCMCYTVGYKYLPVSTFSLICASQLGFNAFFSLFINSLKLTPFIVNSLILLTLSSVILVFENGKNSSSSSSRVVYNQKYMIGCLVTIAASAGDGLILSLTQLFSERVLKKQTFREVLDMTMYPAMVATCVLLVGLFASGEWMLLGREMEEFGLGKVAYLMTLIWTAVCWQVFAIGAVGLIFQVSSLFANVVSTLGLPVVPILAVFVFGDIMSGLKVVAMILGFWGFASYAYQHYLDDRNSTNTTDIEAPKDATSTP